LSAVDAYCSPAFQCVNARLGGNYHDGRIMRVGNGKEDSGKSFAEPMLMIFSAPVTTAVFDQSVRNGWPIKAPAIPCYSGERMTCDITIQGRIRIL
jgi:hypothetical protein